MNRRLSPMAAPALVALACTSPASNVSPPSLGDAASANDASAVTPSGTFGGDRPVAVYVPKSYTRGRPVPLVFFLHGYGASGASIDSYLGFKALAESRSFLYAFPDGIVGANGNRFWNATDACCDFGGTGTDDATYLSQLVDQIKAQYDVDARRVYIIGHSNGGFMAYRMACDHADQIAAVVSIAGAMVADTSKCNPTATVGILQIHGTADGLIRYAGGVLEGHSYPSAETTVAHWVALNGCNATADTSSPALDLDSSIAGAETTVTKYGAGCRGGGHAELWTIAGGSHLPAPASALSPSVIDFLLAHPKP